MCKIDERVYVRTDGHKSVFQDTTLCDRGRRRGKTCSDAKVRRTEYPDPTSSPVADSPLTPTYNTRNRRPSMSSSRPSTRDGPIASLKPEIHIEIGSKKGKGKSYVPTVSITTGKSKRTSTGSTSGSEPSHSVRTGFPDISPPPLGRSQLRPQLGHQRLPSSDDSFSGSSRVPSLYRTSDDYDSPSLVTTTTGASTRPVIHNGPRHGPSPVDTTRAHSGSPASPYRTTEFKPSSVYDETPVRTERDNRNDASYASEITGRDEDRRRRREENRRRQEANDAEYATSVMREENEKHVRFQTQQAKSRNEEQAQGSFSARAQRRAEDGEHFRPEQKVRDARVAKEATAKRPKPPSTYTRSRRGSIQMTSEQQHLVAADAYQMEHERLKAKALEREEQRQQAPIQHQSTYQEPAQHHRHPLTLQERQQDPGYYDPRGARITQPSGQPPIRRLSQSGQPRPDLGRRNSTRDSAPPARQDRHQAPPVAFYNTVQLRSDLPAARERRPSSSHGNGGNPFASPASTSASAAAAADPWDHRNMMDALPSARGDRIGHMFPSQQASKRLSRAVFDSDEEDTRYHHGRKG